MTIFRHAVPAAAQTICLVLVMLAFLNSAGAEQDSQNLSGSLTIREAILAGECSFHLPSLAAVHALNEHGKLQAEWEIFAANAKVNQTHQIGRGFGDSFDDPEESYISYAVQNETREETFHDVRIRSKAESTSARILLIAKANGSASFEAMTNGSSSMRPAARQNWAIGTRDDNSTLISGNRNMLLTAVYPTVAGYPIFDSNSPVSWSVRGDFVIYVWSANVTVETAENKSTYRSGFWWNNATGDQIGPRGVTREEHGQLLRITASNAELRAVTEAGITRWTGPSAETEVFGVADLRGATGNLATPKETYRIYRESVQIRGQVVQTMESLKDEESAIASKITAHNAVLNAPNAARVMVPDSRSFGFEPWIGWGLLVALLGGLFLFVLRRRIRFDSSDVLQDANLALSNHRPRKARRLSRRILRRDPYDADAWFVHGGSLLQEQKYAQILGDFERLPVSFKHRPPVAWILGLAYHFLGRRDEAVAWLARAAQDPQLLVEIKASPLLAGLLREERFRRVLGLASNPAYA